MRRSRCLIPLTVLVLLLDILLVSMPGVSGSPVTCLPNQYKCHDGGCIPALWMCDGDQDCPDGGDEASCPEEVPCAGFRCTDGRCVTLNWRCDGQIDCVDSSDEDPLICGNITCPASKFSCRNGQCVSTKLICNGHNDCTDHSDEEECPPRQCHPEEFLCGSSCVSVSVLCNGKEECPGGVDEADEICMAGPKTPCSVEEFSCDDHCVPFSWRCDGHPDCDDETDEENCGSEPSLLIFNNNHIAKLDLTGKSREDVEFESGEVAALTGNLGASEIFWIDGDQRVIFGKSLNNGTNRREIVRNVGNATSLSVDWIYKLIYWIDSETRTISVSSLDGSKQKVLYKDNIFLPSAVAVDPLTGFIFWADMGETAKIEKVSMNGNNRTPLVTVDIWAPVALALDIKRSFIYWIDSKLNTISRIGMNGQHRKTVLHSKQFLAQPSGIAVFEDKIFWSDMEQDAVYSMSRRLHANVTRVTSMSDPTGLVILAQELQPSSVNLCLDLNAECPFLCVPSPWDPDHSPTYWCLSADRVESVAPSLYDQSENCTIAEGNEMSYNGNWVIAVLVCFGFSLIFCTIICCQTKTCWNFLNRRVFEKSKNYLKSDLDRTSSAAYMLTDLKTEEEDV
ncbi:CD320 antigen [Discoglossus pictus]